MQRDEIALAMRRLRAAERERREAIKALIGLGVVRSKRLVAIEVPRTILEEHYPHGERTSWTKRLEFDPGVRRIARQELPH
jgi:hypothetical protein